MTLRAGRHQIELGEPDKVTDIDDLRDRICRAAGVTDSGVRGAVRQALTNQDVADINSGKELTSAKIIKLLHRLFPPNPAAVDEDDLARRLVREHGLAESVAPYLRPVIKPPDVAKYNLGQEFENKQLNAALKPAGLVNLRLRHDHPVIRPWLREMYSLGAGSSLVVGLDLSRREREHTILELGAVHAATLGELARSLEQIEGEVVLTLVGHIKIPGTKDPSKWTLGKLKAEEIADFLERALAEAARKTTIMQLNLLSCGSEEFGRLLMRSLRERQVAVRLLTAFRDEIPVTPGPIGGIDPPQYLMAGDLDSYREGRGENITSAVGFVTPTRFRTLQVFARMRVHQILSEAFYTHAPAVRGIPIPANILNLIMSYLPPLPDESHPGALNALRRN